jgi:glutamine cyclotransferase
MKSLFYILSVLILLKCAGPQPPSIKLKTGLKNNSAVWGDTLNLNLNKTLKKSSIQFFLNEKSVKSNHILTNEPLGIHTLKAVVSHDETNLEIETKLTILALDPPKLYTYELINSFSHDKTAYTQGLEFDDDLLYESTGLNGKSSLRTVNYKTGKILKNIPLDDAYFAEGLTLLKDKVVQLTWKAQKGFVYDKTSLKMLKSFPYSESIEGWGLCNNSQIIYKSDGSNRIWKLDIETFKELGNIQVMTNKIALKNINELEWVNGKIYANTYQFKKEVAVIIDPESGAVEGVIDFSGLKKQVEQHFSLNVLNGIAYHKKRKTFFVTGKNWSKLFEVKIVPKN